MMPEEVRRIFPERLRRARTNAGLSIRGLARLAGVSPSAIELWENRHTAPTLIYVPAVALVLGVSLEWLVGLEALEAPAPAEGLCGLYERPLDGHGRVVVPHDFRTRMQPPFIFHQGNNRLLELWDGPTWAVRRPETSPRARVDLGAQCRITIPAELRQHARLFPGRTAYLFGAGHYVRIGWSEQLVFPEMHS